jgi:hypothetical protein
MLGEREIFYEGCEFSENREIQTQGLSPCAAKRQDLHNKQDESAF